jgi:hypothetical protein
MSTYRGRTFPEPREGITGAVRTEDDLLSLEDAALPRRRMMIAIARHLREATTVGNPAPIVQRMSERMRDPQPGDLVVETSRTIWGRRGLEIEGFGILLAHREEWNETDEEWAAVIEQERAEHEKFLRGPYSVPGDADEPWEPDERITDHAWYVQYGPAEGDVCRWVNCEFMAIPIDGDFTKPVGTRDGSSVTVTRDDLLGSLADSGFALRSPGQGAQEK